MVALLGFFKQHQILVEHRFLWETDTVHTGKLRTFFVASPVCTGKRCHLHGLDGGCVGDVRAAAEVGKGALGICSDITVFEVGYEFAFIVFATLAKEFQSVGLADVSAYDILFFACELKHFLLDFGKIGICKFVVTGVDVVVETIFDCRADTELHTRVKFLQCLGEQVGATVPECVLAFAVFPLEKFKACVFDNRATEIPLTVVDRCSKHILRQARADTFGYVERSHAGLELLYAIVGKSDINHF